MPFGKAGQIFGKQAEKGGKKSRIWLVLVVLWLEFCDLNINTSTNFTFRLVLNVTDLQQ